MKAACSFLVCIIYISTIYWCESTLKTLWLEANFFLDCASSWLHFIDLVYNALQLSVHYAYHFLTWEANSCEKVPTIQSVNRDVRCLRSVYPSLTSNNHCVGFNQSSVASSQTAVSQGLWKARLEQALKELEGECCDWHSEQEKRLGGVILSSARTTWFATFSSK